MSGFIYLHRGLFSHPLFKSKSPFCEFKAWLWLLEHANFSPSQFRHKHEIYTIPRGTLATSYRALAEHWHWSPNRAIRVLNLFQKEGMIEIKTEHGFVAISICNYSKYQEPWNDDGTQAEQRRNTDGTATDTNQIKAKKGNKEKKGPADLPDWLPVDLWRDYLEMRKNKRASPTDKAIVLLLAKLDSWRAKGHDPSEILSKSITSNWTDLYEPKGNRNENDSRIHHGHQQPTKADRGKEAVRRAAIAGGFAPEEWIGEQEGTGSPFIP